MDPVGGRCPIVDIGCGNGWLSLELQRFGKVTDYMPNNGRKKEIPKGSITDDGELTLEIMESIFKIVLND